MLKRIASFSSVLILSVFTFISGNLMAEKVTTKSGLSYETTMQGSADAQVAKAGQKVSVHYTGWLTDPAGERGRKFDSSKDRGQPFQFPLGAGMVIKGWDEGVEGMKVGETRVLYIPSSLGYGERGAPGAIPPSADLIFEVELLSLN